MKLKKLFIVVLLLLLIPLNVNAASISKTNIEGVVGAEVGTYFTQTFGIYVSDVNKNSEGLGIGGIVFKLDFDEDVFSLTSMYENESFDTKVYKEGSSYYIMSTINENVSAQNRCIDGILYCSDYSLTLKFYIKNTDKTTSTITMSEVNAILFNTNSDYSESSAITVSKSASTTQNIKIQPATTTTTSEPASISVSSGSRNTSSATSKVSSVAKSNASNSGSSNQTSTTQAPNTDEAKFTNYLSSLEVKGHDITFDKEKTNYKVLIKKKENKLEVVATPEDQKSKVEVQGAEDLKKNNYTVLVIVTAEDGYKRTYVIHAVEDVKDEKIVEKKPIIDMKWIKKNKNYIYIGLGSIAFIILTIFIINKRKDKKLDKMFDNFDEFE